VAVLPVSGKFAEYAKEVAAELTAAGFRAYLDDRNEKLQAKIRDSEMQKVPYMTVVGGKEAEARTVSVRHHGKGDLGPRPLATFLADLRGEVDARATSSDSGN
jgi:threonyl-tRNA synthetase